jgi:raffinose/stachyose/melibiose transport system permease protein
MDQSLGTTKIRQRSQTKERLGLQRFIPLPFLLPALIIYAVFALYPMVNALELSFYNWDGVSIERNFVGLQNYVQIFTQDPVFWTAVRNSIIWVVMSLIAPTLVGLLLALALNQRLFGRTTMRAIFYLPAIIASIAVATIWSWMYNPILGVINASLKTLGMAGAIRDWLGDPTIALFSIFVAYIWQSNGVAMVLFLAGLQGVPDELKEAARVDGANNWQTFWNVIRPCLRETFIVVMVLTVINSLKVFDLIVGMTSGGPGQSTQVLALWSYTQSFGLHDFGNGMAIAMVLLVVTLIIVVPYLLWTSRESAS